MIESVKNRVTASSLGYAVSHYFSNKKASLFSATNDQVEHVPQQQQLAHRAATQLADRLELADMLKLIRIEAAALNHHLLDGGA